MPQVPGLTPTVQPSGAAPEINLPVPVDAFGGAVGHALESFGGQIEHSSDQIWQRALELKEIQNRAEVDKGDVEFMKQAGIEHAKFSAMQGDEATAYFPTYVENLNKIREKIRGEMLTNPASQRMYDTQTLGTLGRTVFNGAGHAGEQAKVSAWQANQMRIQEYKNQAARFPEDEGVVNNARDKVKALTVYGQRDIRGVSDPEALRGAATDQASSINAGTLQAVADKSPFMAEEKFEEYKKDMNDEDIKRTKRYIEEKKIVIGAPNIARKVLTESLDADGNFAATRDEMEEKVRDTAMRIGKGDPQLADHAVSQFKVQYNDKIANDRAARIDGTQTVKEAIMAGAKSQQQLEADPHMNQVIRSLPASVRIQIPGWINNYNAARDRADNDQTIKQIIGMRTNDKEAFLDFDPLDPKYKLSTSQINQIQSWQKSDKKGGPTGDPDAKQKMQWLKEGMLSQMQAANLMDRKDNKDEYDSFTGKLSQAIVAWKDVHSGKPPTYNDVIDTIGPAMFKEYQVPGRIWGTNSTAGWQMNPTQAYIDKYKQANPNATDEDVNRAFFRTMLLKNFPPMAPTSK